MDKHEELDNWENVRYRMKEEGIECCFRHYSSFPEIDDQQFHSLRLLLIETMDEMETLVNDRIDELETQIEEDDE
jgi:hypothetical protein